MYLYRRKYISACIYTRRNFAIQTEKSRCFRKGPPQHKYLINFRCGLNSNTLLRNSLITINDFFISNISLQNWKANKLK